ncbi:hypothetical protein RND71_038275 [Anisodus tanguticus]|uniref:Polygalacturonase n=1 Tax=Anisodus tanguticus TaxID=243964 RepID=A0AAE1UZ06_9SOLA|nr:hypothetical protein RND71_038275 [Anisodus tanguticus]
MELNIKASFAFLLLFLARLSDAQTPAAQPAVFDITKYGASSNGDISKALLDAFKEACASTSPSTIVIPKGTFEMAQVKLQGPCKAPLELQVQATLKANADPKQLSADIEWLTVNYIDRFTLSGGGIFDGQGKAAWSQNNCKDSKSCGNLPNLTSTAPPRKHQHRWHPRGAIEQCEHHRLCHWHGDDCISIGDELERLHITRVTCGPGHGISVGSLGKTPGEKPVVGVYVKNCTFINTDNGVRVKTWPASHQGVVTDLHYEDIIVQNVTNPIVIDQVYCPYNQCNKDVDHATTTPPQR